MKNLIKFILIIFCFLTCCSDNKELETIYYPNGIIQEQHEKRNGKYDGDSFYYYENGMLQSQGRFKRGKMDGEWNYYYPDGKIMTTQKIKKSKTLVFDCWDQDGHKVVNNGTGTITIYYPNGSIKSINSYKNGHFDGTNINWYPNGLMENEQYFDEGKPIGVWHSWDNEGNMIYEENFDVR